MQSGTIFDIKEFAVFDGPGMRQTVFFKGCPLRCSWCHNPEGLCMQPQLMVSLASCTDCGRCRAVCTHESCIACGDCVAVCPQHLRKIAGEKVTADELEKRIRKNAAYYARYGGGVTFSGGEPLMQASFLIEVLERVSDLHRAIETSGFCEPEQFAAVVSRLDYVMMDLKIFDDALHRKYTGVSNEKILANARQLVEGDTPFVIRIPVIPGINDTEENYRSTASFLKGAKKLQKVELLPYHKTAGAKYGMLGMEYKPDFDTNSAVRTSVKLFEEYEIRCEVL